MQHPMNARSIRVIQLVWLLVAITATVGWIVGPASQWTVLQTICHPDSTCHSFQLDSAAARTLAQHGLSPRAYALFTVAILVIFWLLWFGLASLIILRKAADRGALLTAFVLVLIPLWGDIQWLPSNAVVNEISGAFIAVLLLFCLLFPDGRFAPRWTRWLALGILLLVILGGSPLPGAFTGVLTVLFMLMFASVIAAQVYRYRAISTWVQRQQTKWGIFGLAVAILGLAAIWIGQDLAPFPTGNGSLYLALTNFIGTASILSAIPLCIGIAVLRNQLWDIDRIINRALVYGSLTGTLIAIYIGCVIGLQALSRVIIGGSSSLVIALSTLAIAALAGPLRRWIQRGIDRRFYRRKYDAQKTLAAFGERLRNEVDLTVLSQDLTLVVRDTVQPEHASLWLRE
jgi:hypothetical protein